MNLQESQKIAMKMINQTHLIKWVAPWHGEHRSVQGGRCENCGEEVFLATDRKIVRVSGELSIKCKEKI
jgi:hypothetical protein